MDPLLTQHVEKDTPDLKPSLDMCRAHASEPINAANPRRQGKWRSSAARGSAFWNAEPSPSLNRLSSPLGLGTWEDSFVNIMSVFSHETASQLVVFEAPPSLKRVSPTWVSQFFVFPLPIFVVFCKRLQEIVFGGGCCCD